MMRNMALRMADSPSDSDDLYTGFDDYNATLDFEGVYSDVGFQRAVASSRGRRPGTSFKMPQQTVRIYPSDAPRPFTRVGLPFSDNRPMTAIRAAGFSSVPRKGPAGAYKLPAPLDPQPDGSPFFRFKAMERTIFAIVDDSIMSSYNGDFCRGLDKAREAHMLEKALLREKLDTFGTKNPNADLSFMVLFNLANQYENNKRPEDALKTYIQLTKTKVILHSGRIKLNIGNLFFAEKKYDKAMKMFQMALDEIPIGFSVYRIRILENLALTFVKKRLYYKASQHFEEIMHLLPSYNTGMNLLVCYYVLNDRENMIKTFKRTARIPVRYSCDEHYREEESDDKQMRLILEVIRNDRMRDFERIKRFEAERTLIIGAKLIAPVISVHYSQGYDWCVEQLKASEYLEFAYCVQLEKANAFMHDKDFNAAIQIFKSFDKRDTKLAAAAAVNLAFILICEENYESAEKYVNVALSKNRFHPGALVNKGNIFMAQGELEKAKECYEEALRIDSCCIEALYNLGLARKRLNMYPEAFDTFYKVNSILKCQVWALYQLGDICETIGATTQALDWFEQVKAMCPTDARLLQRMGDIYDQEGDKTMAFQCHYESYTYDPTNVQVLEWLGAYYVESQFCEKAIPYFEKASRVQPHNVKWGLLIASCQRKVGNYQKAFNVYKEMNKKFPNNIDCLKFLVKMSNEQKLPELKEFSDKLKRAEKIKALTASAGQQPLNVALMEQKLNRCKPRPMKRNITKELEKYLQITLDDPVDPPPIKLLPRPRTALPKHGIEFPEEIQVDDLLP